MMAKNGLFLCSIGFLVLVYSVNSNDGTYNFSSIAIAACLIAAGGYFFFRGKKKDGLKDGKKNSEVKK